MPSFPAFWPTAGLRWSSTSRRPAQRCCCATCLATQFAWTRARRLPAFDARSALISGLSLCLLCRANDPLLAAAAAVIAISSKFLVRIRGKHVFNPTNIGLAVMLLLSDAVWVSPGQWGNPAWFAFLMAGLGFLVVTRAARADVTLAFLCFYFALVAGRSSWLGEPRRFPSTASRAARCCCLRSS